VPVGKAGARDHTRERFEADLFGRGDGTAKEVVVCTERVTRHQHGRRYHRDVIRAGQRKKVCRPRPASAGAATGGSGYMALSRRPAGEFSPDPPNKLPDTQPPDDTVPSDHPPAGLPGPHEASKLTFRGITRATRRPEDDVIVQLRHASASSRFQGRPG